MNRNEIFRTNYHTFMHELENLGHMHRINETTESGYYTPHHGVSTSKKFRVVLNASCPKSTGISLNECQLVGAKLQKDLATILMSFRSHKIALTADIVKMYRQVEVAPVHRKYQKILWRFNPNEPVGVYEISRVIYGQAAAPFLAVRAMQQCAHDHAIMFPIGAKAVPNSFHVDDVLTGADTIQEAKRLKEEMTNLLNRGSFELAKWCSNSNKLANKESPQFLEIQDEEVKSVLGLRWLPAEDKFVFHMDAKEQRSNWTKREIPSEIGKLYDPNGFIGPVVITAKILMQRIWQEKTNWDEPVPELINIDWNSFLIDLKKLHLLAIPRWLGMSQIFYTQLHAFSDASAAAYAAAVYMRTPNKSNGSAYVLLAQSTTEHPLDSKTRAVWCPVSSKASWINSKRVRLSN